MAASTTTRKKPAKRSRTRGNGQGSTYPDRSKGLWYARIRIGTKPDGRPNFKRSSGFKNKTDADLELRRMLNERDKGIPTVDGVMTFGMALDEWLRTVENGDSEPRTRDTYAYCVSLVKPVLGDLELSTLTVHHIDNLLTTLRQKGGTRVAGLSPTTVRLVHGVIYQALQRAVKRGYVAANVAASTDPISGTKKDAVKAMKPDQYNALFREARGDRLEALYVTAIYTGLRKGELLGLRWQDIDLDRGILRVRQQAQRPKKGPMFLKELKTGRSRRDLDIPPDLVALLVAHRDRQHFESTGPDWNADALVFPSRAGGILTDEALRKQYNALLARAGLSGWTIHDLRHTAASIMFGKGMELAKISRILGHASIAVTDRFYVDWSSADGGSLSVEMAGLRAAGSS